MEFPAESVMAGLVPAIHAFIRRPENVDARDKPGHDGFGRKLHPKQPFRPARGLVPPKLSRKRKRRRIDSP
ncbi:hypothetical protein E4K65_45785, partial [Bradyrhizobium niftali]